MNLLRWIACLPGLRRVLLRPRVRSALASILALRFLKAALLTTRPARFVVAELVTDRARIRTWPLRSGGEVTLMHGRDLEAFYELFLGGEYEPPAELEARLASPRLILDIGGNIGMFANWAHLQWPGAEITSFEPAPENTTVFRSWLETGKPATLVEAAAMTAAGHVRLGRGSGSGRQVSTAVGDLPGTDTIPAVDIFDYLPCADLVKIDIEGGEWPILADPRMRDLTDLTLVMEFHRAGAPRLPAYDAARDLLVAAGFSVGHPTLNYWGHGTLWAWKDSVEVD